MKHPGNGAVAIHDEGRVCAIGGWDGRVRLFSTKSFKSLGTLVHHKAGIQALAFAHARLSVAQSALFRQHCCRRHHHTRHRHYHHQQKQYRQENGGQCHANATDGGGAAAEETGTEADKADIEEDRGRRACGDGNEIDEDGDEDDEMTTGEKARRARWLVSGGKDGRVVIWELMDFNRARFGGFGRTETAKE